MATSGNSAAETYRAKKLWTDREKVPAGLYTEFESPTYIDAVLLDHNVLLDPIRFTERDVSAYLNHKAEEDLGHLFPNFNQNFDPETREYRDRETFEDTWLAIKLGKLEDVDFYCPDNAFGKIKYHSSKGERIERVVGETLQRTVIRFLEQNTSKASVKSRMKEDIYTSSTALGSEPELEDEDRAIAEAAEDLNAVVATYDSHFQDKYSPEAYTPKQVLNILQDQR